jgi:RimJ/RimL family protein N-acetyltransferase
MFPKSAENISETESFINHALEEMEQWIEYQIVIINKTTKEFIGCWWIHRIKSSIPELGIRIKKGAFGKKIGREAVAWLTDRAQENLDFEYLFYPVDKDNIPSRKIAESLWGIVQSDENGNEIVKIKNTLEPNKKLNSVEYRIYKQK